MAARAGGSPLAQAGASILGSSSSGDKVSCQKCGGDGVMGCDLHHEFQKACKSCNNLAPSGKKCHQCNGTGVVSGANMKAFGSKFDALEAHFTAVLSDRVQLLALWKRIDYNGNNIVSLAEIDKLISEKYPLLDHKPALIRAYKSVTAKESPESNGDAYVNQKEFPGLLRAIFYFNRLQTVFDSMDAGGAGGDKRITFEEFKSGLPRIGIRINDKDAFIEFARIDKNKGGMILFEEFCQWVCTKKMALL